MGCPHRVRKGGAHRQRLPEEEPSLHSCVVGHFKHYFDTFWIVHSWLRGETFRLPLLLLLQRLKLETKKTCWNICLTSVFTGVELSTLPCVRAGSFTHFLMTMLPYRGYFSLITCFQFKISTFVEDSEGKKNLFQTK